MSLYDSFVDQARLEQARAAMPLVAELLDSWDNLPNDLLDQILEESPGLVDTIRKIDRAMEGLR